MQVGKYSSLKLLLIQAFVIYLCSAEDAVFHFEQAAISVDEGQGSVDVNVVNTGNTSFNATLRINLLDGSADVLEDYVPVSGEILNFQPGETVKGLTINITDDNLIEGAEQFNITLSIGVPSHGLTIGRPSVIQITITDNDAPAPASMSQSMSPSTSVSASVSASYLASTLSSTSAVSSSVGPGDGTVTGGQTSDDNSEKDRDTMMSLLTLAIALMCLAIVVLLIVVYFVVKRMQ